MNCCDESSIPNSGDKHSGWRSVSTSLTITLAVLFTSVCWPLPTLGQGWDALFSDYLLTGQEPRPAVARIVAPDSGGTSLGSGVLVDINASQALVLTNWHVVRDSRSAVLVQFPDGFQSAGTVIRVDATWDLAAIVIWKPNVEPVALAARAPALGETLTIAGYGRGPYREVSGGCTQYLSPGSGQPLELVELVGEARQGDSGGPIFNTNGELAGVLFGESGGRTIGASSPRVRAFLASVGSDGYTAPASPEMVAASGQPAPAPPLVNASHRLATTSEPTRGQPPTLAITSELPSADKPPEPPAASPTQPPTPETAPQALASAPPAAASPLVAPPAALAEPPAPTGLSPGATTPEATPPPLEFADIVAAVKAYSPSGNPQNLLAVIAAGTMIVFGLRGISRVMS